MYLTRFKKIEAHLLMAKLFAISPGKSYVNFIKSYLEDNSLTMLSHKDGGFVGYRSNLGIESKSYGLIRQFCWQNNLEVIEKKFGLSYLTGFEVNSWDFIWYLEEEHQLRAYAKRLDYQLPDPQALRLLEPREKLLIADKLRIHEPELIIYCTL